MSSIERSVDKERFDIAHEFFTKNIEKWVPGMYRELAGLCRLKLYGCATTLANLGLFDDSSTLLDKDTSLMPILSLCQDKNDKRQVHMDRDGTLYVCDKKKYKTVGLMQPYPGTIEVWDWDAKRKATDVEVVQMLPQVLEDLKTHLEFTSPRT